MKRRDIQQLLARAAAAFETPDDLTDDELVSLGADLRAAEAEFADAGMSESHKDSAESSHKQQPVYWLSPVDKKDDFGDEVEDTIIDGRTVHGPWAMMTPRTHEKYGVGLGLGRGQKYEKQPDGKWLKVEG